MLGLFFNIENRFNFSRQNANSESIRGTINAFDIITKQSIV